MSQVFGSVIEPAEPPIAIDTRPAWRQRSIRHLWSGVDVSRLLEQLHAHPELWNQHRPRTASYVHGQVDDIWVRYNAWQNYDEKLGLSHFNREHDAVWYPGADLIPAAREIALDVMRMVEGVRLGGVLITRIPPGGTVQKHIDRGWHAAYYDKFAVQLAADPRQAFHFEDVELVSEVGDIYTFDNSRVHWVTNASDVERITLIVCVRLDHPGSLLWVKE